MSDIKEITAQELRNSLLENEKVLIIDVRSKEEFEEAHIENAVLMELPSFNQEQLEKKCKSVDNLQTVIFQCRSGIRSKIAMQSLENFPYKSYNLQGGISSWAGLGYNVILDDNYED